MGYVLGQYNKNRNVADDSSFMTEIKSGVVTRQPTASDSGATGSDLTFENECIMIPEGISGDKYYYFHGKIKRMDSEQTFYVKLIRTNDTTNKQYIKTITVASGNPNEWVDVEFIFSPYFSFNAILFELKRTSEDYTVRERWPKIIYEELSIINNIISLKIGNKISLIKMGIQSRPGLIMCINGEEIRISRTGIYEFQNGNILIDFFSVTNAAVYDRLDEVINEINAEWAAAPADRKDIVKSRCLFSANKSRQIDSFTLDYLYREE